METFLAAAIFLGAYAFIALERIHKTIVALTGAALMLLLGIVEQEESFFSEELGIDYNVIFLLISMMLIINITLKTGLFQWLAIKSAKLAHGHPIRIMLILSVVTAMASALLDNVTTVLLIAPVTILISQALKIDPVPFLITEILASNIGGTATLIGDPPNIMIASKAEFGFMDFIINLAPVVVLILVVYLITVKIIFRGSLSVSDERRDRLMRMDEREAIKDRVLLYKCLFVLALTILGFLLHSYLDLEPATVAMAGAALLFLLSREHPQEILRDVEWPTIFFFVGLFIMVGSLVKVGLIKELSEVILDLTEGNLFGTSMFILWFSAFASSIVDNIPYVATMNPLIIDMGRELWPGLEGTELLHNEGLLPIWWSLALGSCLGGNGTLVGASANVIVAGISEKAGFPISFKRFALYGMPLMIESVIIASLYVWLRYYVF
jgi:Na+/H+ antiporter NhaD/arsenite permease-like protein